MHFFVVYLRSIGIHLPSNITRISRCKFGLKLGTNSNRISHSGYFFFMSQAKLN